MKEDKKISGTVILYHPDIPELEHNISTYLEYIDELFVIDNTPGQRQLQALSGGDPRVIYISNGKNEGIARALNKAAELATAAGSQWLMTMDQDSSWDKEQAETFFSIFRKETAKPTLDIAVMGPAISRQYANPQILSKDVTALITSGSVVSLNILHELGGFDEKLFIDEVDHEYCYRAISYGFRVVQVPATWINHRLGKEREGGYLRVAGRRKRIIHSPDRVYFMIRNYLFVRKKYLARLPEEFQKRDREVLVSIKNNLLFSGQFLKVLRRIREAVRDFKQQNFSRTI